MAEKILDVKFQQRCDTETNWKNSDPILLENEVAYSSDKNGRYKIGDGTSKWSALSYAKSEPLDHTHSYLPLSGGTETGVVTFKAGSYVHNFTGTSGSYGYVNFADITIGGTYINIPLIFELVNRKAQQSMEVFVQFSSVNTQTPTLSTFTYRGYDIGCYIVQDTDNTSLWHLYAKKSEGYDNLCVTRFHKSSYMSNVTVSWVNVHATALPTGYSTASLYNPASSATTASKIDNSLIIKLDSGTTEGANLFTFNGSAGKTVNITPASIGAAAENHGTHVTFGTDTPKAPGTAATGTATTVSRSDHVHPLQTSVSGNAGTATKWATARNINGMSIQGDANRVNYGTCSTAAATVAKTVACAGFTLITGAEITVRFTVTNTASYPTLNVNNTGAKNMLYRGINLASTYKLQADCVYTFRYNGAAYDLVGDLNTNTEVVNNLTSTSTASALSAAQGKELKTLIDGTTVSQADINAIFA